MAEVRELSDGPIVLPTRLRVSMGRAERSAGHQRSKTLGIPFVAILSLVFFLLARAVDGVAESTGFLTAALLGIWMVLAALGDLLLSLPKTVSVIARTASVVLTPPWAGLTAISLLGALVWLSLARLWLVPEQWTGPLDYPRIVIILGPLVGLVLIAEALWRLRRPAGLTLSERGLTGVRAGPQFFLPWAAIGSVSVAEGKKRRLLVLTAADGPGMVAISGGLVGGDTYAVATVINYYLHHPEERGRLSDGLDAVRHVDAEVSAGRFDGV